ncbi:MAG: polyisoprenoid-binding protein [Gammaproteobacteria bacterium]|nr:polyisoprenoid-binding protein [Gammaproteobacteria bacterium]
MSARTQLRYVKNSHRAHARAWILIVMTALRLEAAQTYRLDSSNTQVSFSVHRFGIEWVTARFSDIRGQFTVDKASSATRVDVTVEMASLECGEPHWNERLRSADWLDVQRYPQMTYHSSRIELGEQRAVASGQLTLHGVTRPMVLNVSLLKCSASPGNCQFAAHGRIKRSDYGLPHGLWTGGDQVDISISGTLVRGANSTASG